MKAEIQASFSRGFLLHEEALKKIEDLSRARFGNEQKFDIKYVVKRADHASIEYQDSNELLMHEDNSKISTIKKVEFSAKSQKSSVKITFEEGEKTKLSISSDNRDAALILSADLKEYLRSDVFLYRSEIVTRLATHRAAPVFLMMITTLFPILGVVLFTNRLEFDISNSSIEQKIDFLVESQLSNSSNSSFLEYWLYFIIFSFFLFVSIITNIFSSPYTFYWGKGVTRYDAAKSMREKIFWGIVVAFIIGVFGSLLAGKIEI